MYARYLLGTALAAACVPVLLGGCSGTPSATTPGAVSPAVTVARPANHQRRSTLLSRAAHHKLVVVAGRSWMKHVPPQNPLLYISDAYTNTVSIYQQAGSGQSPVGQITGFSEPQGLWVDVNQNLWVANTEARTLQAYHRGTTTPFRTLSDPNGFPAGVCGNNNKSIVYGPDIVGNSYTNGQTINVYAKGATSPTSVLTDTNAVDVNMCAVDSHGNLFVTIVTSYYPYYSGGVDEFFKGTTTPVVLVRGLVYPIGITMDKFNAMAVNDYYGNPGSTIYLFNPPYTGGSAYNFNDAYGDLIQIAIDRTQRHIWAGDALNLYGIEWSYPHGTFQNVTSTSGLVEPEGVALSPAAKQ